MSRLIFLLICLALTGWTLDQQQQSGRFQEVDEGFLDFLVANGRERLTQLRADADSQVAFIALNEQDRAEYETWPPSPLDWQTLLNGLRAHEPSVVLIATPLNWGRPSPEFVPAVASALLPYSSVVMGIETTLTSPDAPKSPAFLGDLGESLPRFEHVRGEFLALPRLSSLISAPDASLRGLGELGLMATRREENQPLLPYALDEEEGMIASVLAQTLARWSRTPFSRHRLRLGPGAGAYLEGGVFVPLEPTGDFKVNLDRKLPSVNALHLMMGNLADGTTEEDKQSLGQGKIIVIGVDQPSQGDEGQLGRLYARALDQIMALPRLQRLTTEQQWIAWGLATLGAAWIVISGRRQQALWKGLGLIFGALILSYLVFESSLIWCPPTIPSALIACGAFFGRLFGQKSAVLMPPMPVKEGTEKLAS